MGGASSVCGGGTKKVDTEDTTSIEQVNALSEKKWRLSKHTFEADGTLIYDGNRDYILLRDMLDDPVGQRYIGEFAKAKDLQRLFFSWVDIEEYRQIPTSDFRYCQAKRIFSKYIKVGGVQQLDSVSDSDRTALENTIREAKAKRCALESDLFSKIHHQIFRNMVGRLFIQFKQEGKYSTYAAEKRKVYNRIETEDFEYLEILGRGGFGKVIRVRKKSTGISYAMKIMDKTNLMLEFRDDRDRVTIERDILMCCDFPFIVGLQYAFQTDRFCFLLLDLAEAGDLKGLVKANRGRLPTSAVVFFSAEIFLALHHLHEMDLVYRDLKPANVLVGQDGHVKLADMGLAGAYKKEDFKYLKRASYRYFGNQNPTCEPLDQKMKHKVDLSELNKIDETLRTTHATTTLAKHSKKRTSVVGTFGYKAPEMFTDSFISGYGPSVDFWSLGIMIYTMLIGKHPFDLDSISKGEDPYVLERTAIRNKIQFPKHIQSDAKSLIQGFLCTNPLERLGCGNEGFQQVLDHPFYEKINWIALMVKELDPPFKPQMSSKVLEKQDMKPKWESWEEFEIDQFGKQNPEPEGSINKLEKFEQEIYENNWNYVSPSTVRAELGIVEAYKEEFLQKNQFLATQDAFKRAVHQKNMGDYSESNDNVCENKEKHEDDIEHRMGDEKAEKNEQHDDEELKNEQ